MPSPRALPTDAGRDVLQAAGAPCLLRLAPGDARRDAAERFVYDTYRALGFCDPSPRQRVEEAEPWRDRSVLHVVTVDGAVAGVARTVTGPWEELPTGAFHPDEPLDVQADPAGGALWVETGSLATKRRCSYPHVARDLIRAAIAEAFAAGAVGSCFIIERTLGRLLERRLGYPVRTVSPARWYMGGEVAAAVVLCDDLRALVDAGTHPDAEHLRGVIAAAGTARHDARMPLQQPTAART